MNYWRIRLRAGKGGQDMWPLCKKHDVAAITYDGVNHTDLGVYSENNHPPGWNEIRGGAAKKSLSRFAWEIRGGDTLFVADSARHQIVGMGHPRAPIGELAYRFDRRSPIAPKGGGAWCHLIDMDWADPFASFHPAPLRATQLTVLDLRRNEVESFVRASQKNQRLQESLNGESPQPPPLFDKAYPRYTPAALHLIRRKHVVLSNQFRGWLDSKYKIPLIQEKLQIDATFQSGNLRFLVEFKIAYLGNTKRAIREALGQILEYNYYPPRKSRDCWLLVLDVAPRTSDKAFLLLLRNTFHLPLSLGWQTNSSFRFEPPMLL